MPTSGVAAPALLEALPDVVVVADVRGRIVYTNPAVRSLLGHEPRNLRGLPLTVLIPERLRAAHTHGFARFLSTGSGTLVGATTQVPARHADGSEVAVELTLSRLDGGLDGAAPTDEIEDGAAAGGVVIAVLRDASTLFRLERQLEVGRYLTATLRVTAALTEARNADVAFQQLLPTLCAELDWDAATLWQPDGPGGPLVHTGTWTPPGATVPALQADIRRRSFARGEGLPGLAWQRGAPVVMEDLWADQEFLRTDAARADVLRTGIAFPVLRGEDLLAVCELFSREPVRCRRSSSTSWRAPAGRSASSWPGCARSPRSASSPTRCNAACCPPTCPPSPGSSSPPGTAPAPRGSSSAATPTTWRRCPTVAGWCSSPTSAAPGPRRRP